jgi:hypothetical protein
MDNDLQLRSGKVLPYSAASVVRVGDDWMIPTSFQPLQCDMFPQQSYLKSLECNHERALVEEVCDIAVRRQMKSLPGDDIDACFSQSEVFGLSGTRLYDDCITELCHKCPTDADMATECEPSITLNEFKSVCVKNGITRDFRWVNFTEAVQDARKVVA